MSKWDYFNGWQNYLFYDENGALGARQTFNRVSPFNDAASSTRKTYYLIKMVEVTTNNICDNTFAHFAKF